MLLTLLFIGTLASVFSVPLVGAEKPIPPVNDALVAPDVPRGSYPSAPVHKPGYYETSEYLIGSAAVGIVFLESNGAIDASTEDWTEAEQSRVVSEIATGLNWLAGQNLPAGVSFVYDIQYGVPTSYEPINHPSYIDQGLWIGEAMTYLGFPGTSYFTQVRDYINDLRNTLGTDWAYAMFIVDSSNDPDGRFTNGYSAYAYLGGPFLVMTYDNDGYGIGNMDYVTAHESCHIFYATDEYNGYTETSGYLGVQDWEGSGCMMQYANTWWLCTNSKEQLGWRDTDGDGIQDIVDTIPDTTLNPYLPDPTDDVVLTYTGSVTEVPYPNNNPIGTGRDVTINTVTDVEFSVDLGNWADATPTDGEFDTDSEDYTFNTFPLSPGTHIVEARGANSVGNAEIPYANDTITVTGTPVPTYVVFTLSPNPALDRTLVTLLGNLTVLNAGNPIGNTQVFVYVDGAFSGTLQTNSTGWFAASGYAPMGSHQVNVTYAGNATYWLSSHVETLTVYQMTPTNISFTLAPNPATAGQPIALTGNLTDIGGNPIGGAPMELWFRVVAGSWQYAAMLSTNGTGWFQASGSVGSAGTYEVAVIYRGTSQYSLSYRIETLTVNPAKG
ncbi:MAG: hypothetical protein ACE14S_08290 [Candidatus Bathyarchaeia archaeon]